MRTVGSSASRIVTLAPGARIRSTARTSCAISSASARRNALAAAKPSRRDLVLRLHRLAGDARRALDRAVHAVGGERDAARRLDAIAATALHGERERVAAVALVGVVAAARARVRNAAQDARWVAGIVRRQALRELEGGWREAGLGRHARFHRDLPGARRNVVGERGAAHENQCKQCPGHGASLAQTTLSAPRRPAALRTRPWICYRSSARPRRDRCRDRRTPYWCRCRDGRRRCADRWGKACRRGY